MAQVKEHYTNSVLNHIECQNKCTKTLIMNNIREELNSLIFSYSNTSNQETIKSILKQQCSDDKCLSYNNELQSIFTCPCVKRITIILKAYQISIEYDIPIAKIIIIFNIYEVQQIVNDFIHIQSIHINKNDNAGKTLYHQFKSQFECNQISKCLAFKRHYGDRYQLLSQPANFRKQEHNTKCNEDIMLQQQCEKIHCYFLHPYSNQGSDDKINASIIGNKEDEQWIGNFDQCKNDELGYELLVKQFGIFSWQSVHGQNRAIMHIKPRFANIKEEAINNEFKPLAIDNWNQTRTKAETFYQS